MLLYLMIMISLFFFCRQATSTGFNSEGIEDYVQTNTTDVFFYVMDEDTLPPQFQPCEDLGEGVCVPPMYTAEVKSGTIDVSNTICIFTFRKLSTWTVGLLHKK